MERKKSNISQSKRKDIIFYICISAIPLLQFIIFYVYVNINSVVLAFQEYAVDRSTNRGYYTWCGLQNFKDFLFKFFHEGVLVNAMSNTILAFSINLIAGIGLSMVFSYYISKKMILHSVFQFVLFVPSMISSVVVVLIFRYFSENALLSVFNSLFDKNLTGLLYGKTKTALLMVLIFNVWSGFGTMILMFSGAMSGINESIVEAAELDGANHIQEFFRIYIPMIYPTLVTFIVVNVAGIFSNQINLYSFYGAQAESGLWTIGYWLFKNLSKGDLSFPEYPVLSAAGVFLTIIVTPLTLLIKYVLEKYGPSVE